MCTLCVVQLMIQISAQMKQDLINVNNRVFFVVVITIVFT